MTASAIYSQTHNQVLISPQRFTFRLHLRKAYATLLDEDRIVMTGERPGSPQTPVMREMHRLHGEGKVAGHTPGKEGIL